MTLIKIIENRKSTWHYDPHFTIDKSEIIDSIHLATKSPNGNNIQSTRYLIIEDQSLRKKIRKVANNQKQVETSSYLILILGDYRAFEERNIRDIQEQSYQKGFLTEEIKNILTDSALNYYQNMTKQDFMKELVRDGSLATMTLILSLNEKGYQTITMSGYDKEQLFKELNIPEYYEDIMLVSVGKAIKPGHSTMRHAVEKVAFTNKVE